MRLRLLPPFVAGASTTVFELFFFEFTDNDAAGATFVAGADVLVGATEEGVDAGVGAEGAVEADGEFPMIEFYFLFLFFIMTSCMYYIIFVCYIP